MGFDGVQVLPNSCPNGTFDPDCLKPAPRPIPSPSSSPSPTDTSEPDNDKRRRISLSNEQADNIAVENEINRWIKDGILGGRAAESYNMLAQWGVRIFDMSIERILISARSTVQSIQSCSVSPWILCLYKLQLFHASISSHQAKTLTPTNARVSRLR